jgi:hypothetical protein
MADKSHRTTTENEAEDRAEARDNSRRAAKREGRIRGEYILNRWIPDGKKLK